MKTSIGDTDGRVAYNNPSHLVNNINIKEISLSDIYLLIKENYITTYQNL